MRNRIRTSGIHASWTFHFVRTRFGCVLFEGNFCGFSRKAKGKPQFRGSPRKDTNLVAHAKNSGSEKCATWSPFTVPTLRGLDNVRVFFLGDARCSCKTGGNGHQSMQILSAKGSICNSISARVAFPGAFVGVAWRKLRGKLSGPLLLKDDLLEIWFFQLWVLFCQGSERLFPDPLSK